jgi:molybdenum cofactor biosynthesis enzyme MoaA
VAVPGAAGSSIMTTDVRFIWLEITGRCQLRCEHCYAESGPWADDGTMTTDDWRRVIDEAAAVGVEDVQFIGGEPTLHSALPELVRHALDRHLGVEVYTNLARPLPEELWTVFEQPGVRLATSYYAADAPTHDRITSQAGSHRRTRANIVEALRRGIPLRAGVVAMGEDHDVAQAMADLKSLGVTEVGVDRLRQVGRGVHDLAPSPEELCGRCTSGRLAVTSSGDVLPCVFSRWLPLGNVARDSLATIASSATATQVRTELEQAFAARSLRTCHPACNPENCSPAKGKAKPVTDDPLFLTQALTIALQAMGLTRDGELINSTFADSVGVRVLDDGTAKWLRVYEQWDRPQERMGWADSIGITGVAKPYWYGNHDFEYCGKPMRADLLSLAPSPAITSQMVLTQPPPITHEWYMELRRSVEALERCPTTRGTMSQERVRRSIERRMGANFPSTVDRWVTSHLDMHWCNLTAPTFCLLDWDSWGLAPCGFGPATAYCSALLVPEVAGEVYETFRHQFETDDGRISLVLAAGHLLSMVTEGHYPAIADPLHELLRSLRE